MATDDRFPIKPHSEDGFEFPPARPVPADSLPPSYINLARQVILHAISVIARGSAPNDPDDSPACAKAFLYNNDDLGFWCKVARWPMPPIQAYIKRGDFSVANEVLAAGAKRDYRPAWLLLADHQPRDMSDWLVRWGIGRSHFRANLHNYARDHNLIAKTWVRDDRQWAQLIEKELVATAVATTEVKP